MPKYLTPKQRAILERSQAQKTASNYSDAVDQNTWIKPFKEIGLGSHGDAAVRAADCISNFLFGKKVIPTAESNCTLTATQWVNPKFPISRAETIIKDGHKYGYVEIPESQLAPGDLVIATNPTDNSHHTMLVSGFTDKQQNHTFQGKDYVLPPDHPLVRYSNGTTHPSGYRRSVGLMEFIDNGDGKTDIKYYRHFSPDQKKVLLPEIVVTPTGSYVPKGQKTIRVNKSGGTLDTTAQKARKLNTNNREVDFSKVNSTDNLGRAIDIEAQSQLQDSLIARNYPFPQRMAILGTSMQEGSPGTYGVGGGGYLGLSKTRMPKSYLGNTPEQRAKQITYILDDLERTHSNNWLNGGSGGITINSGKEGYNLFWNATDIPTATQVLNKSYVRPAVRKQAWDNRTIVANNISKKLK